MQFRDVELVGVGLYEALPAIYAHHSYGVNAGVTLETFERIDQYWLVADIEKLFRDVLPHAVARTACYDDCYVHKVWCVRECTKKSPDSFLGVEGVGGFPCCILFHECHGVRGNHQLLVGRYHYYLYLRVRC